MTDRQRKTIEEYTIVELFNAGMRFTDDYSEDVAVEHYMELHPKADEAKVRADLEAELKS